MWRDGREEGRRSNFGHVAMTTELSMTVSSNEVFMVIIVLKRKKLKSREVHQVSQSHTAEPTVQPGRSLQGQKGSGLNGVGRH